MVTVKLAELLDHNDLDVLAHLERQVTVPVLDGRRRRATSSSFRWR
jgi:hypothetical protein